MMRNEAFYKTKLINYLYKTKMFNKHSIVASEIPVDSFKRRADLLLLDNKIHFFEIKSDIDSLARLEGQLETYTSFADQVTILCSPLHVPKILKQVPSYIGIWILDENDNIIVIRESKYRKIRKKSSLLKHINVTELKRTLSQEGLGAKTGSSTRAEMLTLAQKIKIETLRVHVLSHLMSRYSKNSCELLNKLRMETKIVESSLHLLKRREKISNSEVLSNQKVFTKDLFLTRMLVSQSDLLFGPVPNHLVKYISN
jgi:hypothetical protein